MGAGGSKGAAEIAQIAKQAVNYRPPLGPPNPVSSCPSEFNISVGTMRVDACSEW